MNEFILLGDWGGTNVRLGVFTPDGESGGITQVRTYSCMDFASPGHVIKRYKEDTGIHARQGVFAIAGNAVDPSKIVFTNGKWAQTSLDFTRIGVDKVTTLNDFVAICYGVAELGPESYTEILSGRPLFLPKTVLHGQGSIRATRAVTTVPAQTFIVIGPGTGLGVATGSVLSSGQFLIAGGEGGHGAFITGGSERRFDIEKIVAKQAGQSVTSETLCCGDGIVRIFNVLAEIKGRSCRMDDPSRIVELCNFKDETIRANARETIRIFSETLGYAAANAALVNNAQGGIFIAGGIIPKIRDVFDVNSFKRALRTNDLGKNNFLPNTPVALMNVEEPGLVGCCAYARLMM